VALGLIGYNFFEVTTRAYVPAGKKFNLWALGQGDCGFNNLSNIRAYNNTKGQPLKELGVGVGYEAYETPYEAEGACVIELQGWQSAGTDQHVSGFMVFSIE